MTICFPRLRFKKVPPQPQLEQRERILKFDCYVTKTVNIIQSLFSRNLSVLPSKNKVSEKLSLPKEACDDNTITKITLRDRVSKQ